ncbi:MAG: hypothetical protein V4685_05925 [Bacteroidota bacterium]
MKPIKILLEILGWFQITLAATAIAALPALLLYISFPSTGIIAIIIVCTGFIVGAIWATRIWRKHGTIEWLSQIRRIS